MVHDDAPAPSKSGDLPVPIGDAGMHLPLFLKPDIVRTAPPAAANPRGRAATPFNRHPTALAKVIPPAQTTSRAANRVAPEQAA